MSVFVSNRKSVIFAFALAAFLMASPVLPAQIAHADDSTQEYEQMGAYLKLENAATMVESFRMEGKNAFIRQKEVNGNTLYAVIIDHSVPPPEPAPEATPEPAPKIIQQSKDISKEIFLPTQSGQPGKSIAVYADTPLYRSPEAGAESAGVYSSLAGGAGGGSYSNTEVGFHKLWFPSVKEYGYVMAEDVRVVRYHGSEMAEAEAVQGAAPKPETVPEPETMSSAAVAPVPMPETTPETMPESVPEPAPEPALVETGPRMLVVPVPSPDNKMSIEISSEVSIYDRPFESGTPLGTYDELGGVFIKEYLGWYALKLSDGSFGFIRLEDASPVGEVPAPQGDGQG